MDKTKRLLWIGIIVASCLFSLALLALGVEGNARSIALILWIVAMVIIYAVYTFKTGRKTVQKIEEANRLFIEQHDTDAYITALKALLETEKDLQPQQILRINLTVAYCSKRDYEKALATLKEIPRPDKLNKPNAAFY